MTKQVIKTDKAPQAIGTYSQAVRVDSTVYLSGQIPLVPETMEIVQGDIGVQIDRVFSNLQALVEACGGTLANVVKLTIYLTDLANFARVNEIMASYFEEPYPARAVVEVAGLPKGVAIEVDAILVLDS